MSATGECTPCCNSPSTTAVPGPAGQSAWSTLTTPVVVTSKTFFQNMLFANTDWMVEGEFIYVEGAGLYLVDNVIDQFEVNLQYVDIESNTATGDTLPIGTKAVPSGGQTDGTNAYTETAAGFIVPAIAAPVVISLINAAWIATGQNIFIEDAGYFQVTGIVGDTINATYLNYAGNVNAGANIATGSAVSPAGTQAPLTGLGQLPQESNTVALTQDLTNAFVQVGTIAVTVPATGTYLLMAGVTISLDGTTFASSRTISINVQNMTTVASAALGTRVTNVMTTAVYPAIDYVLPPIGKTLAAGDILQLQIKIDVVETAGDAEVKGGWITLLPLTI